MKDSSKLYEIVKKKAILHGMSFQEFVLNEQKNLNYYSRKSNARSSLGKFLGYSSSILGILSRDLFLFGAGSLILIYETGRSTITERVINEAQSDINEVREYHRNLFTGRNE
jgi:hypothetical protein